MRNLALLVIACAAVSSTMLRADLSYQETTKMTRERW